jgi:hypothetical protein
MAGALAVFGGLGQGARSGRNWRFDPFPLGAFDIFFPSHRAGARDLQTGFHMWSRSSTTVLLYNTPTTADAVNAYITE